MSFAELCWLLERCGASAVLATRDVAKLAGADERAALHRAGVVRNAPPTPMWPCDDRGCSGREVRANYDGAPKPLVAVCCQGPPECEPVELGFDDVARQEVSTVALVGAVCALFDAEVDAPSLASLKTPRALGEARAPVQVGRVGAREVFWAGSPRDTDLDAFCERRERAAKKTLVLVPTARHVPLGVVSRYAHGQKVEVLALDDVLVVKDGALALVGARSKKKSSLARADSEVVTPIRRGIAAELGVTRWEPVLIALVDPHTVRIEANGKALLKTFVELGFVDERRKDVVTPVTGWHLFVLILTQGRMRPSEYARFGTALAATQAMLRMTKPLRAAFGLEQSPMRKYSRKEGWRPRFRVAPPRA